MRIAVAFLKGGAGKTTTAAHLAAGLHGGGRETFLIDADPQGSALRWSERAEFPWVTVALPTKTIHRQVGQLVGKADAVIDTPPGDLGIVASALRAADLLVVPMQPTTADMDQLAETLSLADDVAATNDLVVRILLTRTVKNTRARTLTREALVDAGHLVFDSEVPQSQALALAHGQAITDLGPYADVVAEILAGEVR